MRGMTAALSIVAEVANDESKTAALSIVAEVANDESMTAALSIVAEVANDESKTAALSIVAEVANDESMTATLSIVAEVANDESMTAALSIVAEVAFVLLSLPVSLKTTVLCGIVVLFALPGVWLWRRSLLSCVIYVVVTIFSTHCSAYTRKIYF